MLTVLDSSREREVSKISRSEAAEADLEVQVFVGGQYSLATLDAIKTGREVTTTAATTLDGTIDIDDTDIDVDDASAFTNGTFIIYPNGANEDYELVSYASISGNTFQGCTRQQVDIEATTGDHTDGATVREWFDITALITRIELNEELRENMIEMEAEFSGRDWNSRLMAEDNSILVLHRFRPYEGDIDEWTPWMCWFFGYIASSSVRDDYEQAKEMTLTAKSLSQYVDGTDIPAMNIGRIDLAENASVEVSSELTDPFMEIDSGEYIGYPDLGGDNLIDGDLSTLWISASAPTPTVPTENQGHFQINEVFLRMPPGAPSAPYVWFEIFYYPTDGKARNLGDYYITSRSTNYKGDGTPEGGFLRLSKVGSLRMTADGVYMIICANRAYFERRFDPGPAAHVVDWRLATVYGPEGGQMYIPFSLNPLMDCITLWHSSGNPESAVAWGMNPGDINGQGTIVWSGSPIPSDTTSIPPGCSFRREPDGLGSMPDMVSHWTWPVYEPSPGRRAYGGPQWAKFDLGQMNIELDGQLLSGETSEIPISATLGLTASGYVQIDAEIIKYETRDDQNNKLLTLTRAQYGTTAATHPDESIVNQYEGSTAYNVYPVTSLQWRRKINPTGVTPIPTSFQIFASDFEDPVTPSDNEWDNGPGDGGWQDYWTLVVATSTEMEGKSWQGTWDPIRARNILFVVYSTEGGSRLKMNEISIFSPGLDITGATDGTVGADASWSGDVIKYILINEFGLDEELFCMTDRGRQFVYIDTAKSGAGQIISDLCRRSGCVLIYHRDGRVEHKFNPLYPHGAIDNPNITWTRDNARRINLTNPSRHNCSQVTLRAQDPLTENWWEVSYPPTPLELGSEITLDDMIVGSEQEARQRAEYLFGERNGRRSITLVPVGPTEWARPGQRHLVTWDLDEEGVYFSGANFIVMGCRWRTEFGSKDDFPSLSSSLALQ